MEVKKKTPNAQRSRPVAERQTIRREQFRPASGNVTFNVQGREAFTLIELLVVISIIIVLMGLLFPAFRGVQDQAKKTQAKNDLTQIVTAVTAFYTEYGRYPTASTSDVTFTTANDQLFDVLRNNTSGGNSASVAALNPRGIVFISPSDAKDQTNPRGGVKASSGQYYDPWGLTYNVAVDANYNNIVLAPAYTDLQGNYATATDGTGDKGPRIGVVAWSLGKDGVLGDKTKSDGKFTGSDDVISWQ